MFLQQKQGAEGEHNSFGQCRPKVCRFGAGSPFLVPAFLFLKALNNSRRLCWSQRRKKIQNRSRRRSRFSSSHFPCREVPKTLAGIAFRRCRRIGEGFCSSVEICLKTLARRGGYRTRSALFSKSGGPQHGTYQKCVQGKCPLYFLHFNGVVCLNTLFSNTSALVTNLCFSGQIPHAKVLEHLVWSNTSGFHIWGPKSLFEQEAPKIGTQKSSTKRGVRESCIVEFAMNNREVVKAEVFEKRVFEQTTPLK